MTRHRSARRTAAALAGLALIAILAACVDDGRPATCDGPIVLDLTLDADSLTPSEVAVCRDQEVTLRVASEVDGVIHLHGYDDQVGATPVTAGETLELRFTAARSGQFPIELHPEDDPRGIAVGIFTVHEP